MTPEEENALLKAENAALREQVLMLTVQVQNLQARLVKDLDGYHLFHAIRGELLLDLGHREQARAAELRALGLTGNQAERSLLQRRLSLELL